MGLNRTVFSLSLARMADGIGNSLLYIVIPLYVLKLHSYILHLPATVLIGILISLYGFANAAAQPLVAVLSDRIGHQKRFILGGILLLAVATFSFVFVSRVLDLAVLRVLQGFGLALEIPPTIGIIAIVTRRENRGGGMGFYTSARMLGLAMGPLIGGFLFDRFGFNSTFYAGAGILLLAAVVVQLGVRSDIQPPPPPKPAPHAPAVAPTPILNPAILSAAFGSLLLASTFAMVATLENQFESRLNIGAFLFAVAYSALLIGRLYFQVPFGRISDRVGRKPLLLGGLLLLAPSTALLGNVATFGEFVAVRLIQGMAAAGIAVSALAYAGDMAQAQGSGRQGRQVSVVTIGFGLGIAIGPLLAGILGAIFFQLPFWVEGALCLVGATTAFLFMREVPHNKPAPESGPA